ncbi:MAG TPA: DUF2797 domain-containing protein [Candidatus Saccharimonadales bacterium]|nr:DUF2797 domain-containing protein [Candidatus Saccharimonadales bacterium]
MIEPGTYLLSSVGFSRSEKALLTLQSGTKLHNFEPVGHTFSIEVDATKQYCTGWHDLETGENFVCPDITTVDEKYHQCPACQKKTGFNPAFYNATSVSPQQEKRNQEPHILYLAHFGADVVKVGISYAGRGHARLLEQGARSALILDTFPSAHIARQYEARIAALPGIAETVQLRKKIDLAKQPYHAVEGASHLKSAHAMISEKLGTRFSGVEPLLFQETYFPNGEAATEPIDISDQKMISGTCIGMMGGLLYAVYEETPVFLPIKKFIGNVITLSEESHPLTLPSQQISLF